MALATLSIDLEARLAKLQAGMDQATRLTEKNAAKMQASFDRLKTAGEAIGKSIAAGLSVGAFAAFIQRTEDALLKIKDFSEATGSAIEKISGLEDVARATGGSLDQAGDVLIKFNAALKDAGRNKEVGDVLGALNLDIAELKRLDPADALQAAAKALAGFADDGERARAVQVLFGKSVKDAGPFLRELADATGLVGKVTREQVEAADKFNKQMAALQVRLDDISRTFGGNLLQAINQVTGAFGDADKYAGQLTGTAAGLAVPLQALAVLGANLAFVFKGVGTEIGGIAAQGAALARGDFKGAGAIGQAMREDAAAARAALDELEARLLNINGPANDALRRFEERGFRPQLPGLRLPAEGSRGGSGGGGRSGKSEIPYAITDPFEDTKQRLLQLEKDYEATDKILADIEARANASTAALRDKLAAAGLAVFDATRTPIERLNIELAKQQELLDALGPAYRDTYERATFAAQEAYEAAIKLPEALKKPDDLAGSLGLTFSSAFEDAIVGGKKLSDVLDSLEKDILRIVTRKMVTEPLADAITGFLKPAAGGNAGGQGGGGGFDFGAIFSKLFSGFFADGGYIAPGRWGIAGERGPEPVFGGRTGATVQPAGGMHVTQTFMLQGPVDRRTQQQLAASAARGLQIASQRNA